MRSWIWRSPVNQDILLFPALLSSSSHPGCTFVTAGYLCYVAVIKDVTFDVVGSGDEDSGHSALPLFWPFWNRYEDKWPMTAESFLYSRNIVFTSCHWCTPNTFQKHAFASLDRSSGSQHQKGPDQKERKTGDGCGQTRARPPKRSWSHSIKQNDGGMVVWKMTKIRHWTLEK